MFVYKCTVMYLFIFNISTIVLKIYDRHIKNALGLLKKNNNYIQAYQYTFILVAGNYKKL